MARTKKYRLPKFPEHVIPTFEKLCAVLDTASYQELCTQVDEYVAILPAVAEKKEQVNIDMAHDVAKRVKLILEHYLEFPAKEQSLIVGAARYFLCHDDPVSDISFRSGFDDDARVVNYVLQRLQIEEMFIELEETV